MRMRVRIISKKILEENIGEYSLNSVKVMVSRKTSELISRGDLELFGRRYIITEKGLKKVTKRSYARTTYDLKSKLFSNIQVSIVAPPTDSGKIIFEDREVQKAFEKLNKALESEEDFSILIKKRE